MEIHSAKTIEIKYYSQCHSLKILNMKTYDLFHFGYVNKSTISESFKFPNIL